jgi:DNA mismatch repair protein MutH
MAASPLLSRRPPPSDLAELLARAHALESRSLDELALELGGVAGGRGLRTKGKAGELVERALGATGGSAKQPDFPDLGVELKTIPTDAAGRPLESTYVCFVTLDRADEQEWDTSWVRQKLARVLWVPLVRAAADESARIGRPVLWQPTPDEEQTLRSDFEELMGRIAIGGIEGLTAHVGHALQIRPKARDGSVRTPVLAGDGEWALTVPRGFYLRPTFTARILAAVSTSSQ